MGGKFREEARLLQMQRIRTEMTHPIEMIEVWLVTSRGATPLYCGPCEQPTVKVHRPPHGEALNGCKVSLSLQKPKAGA